VERKKDWDSKVKRRRNRISKGFSKLLKLVEAPVKNVIRALLQEIYKEKIGWSNNSLEYKNVEKCRLK